MLACNFAGDLRAAREEETGRGICPSSLFNSASLVNSPPSSRRFSPWRSYHGRPPLYFPSAAARLATVPPIQPGPTRPATRRPTPRAPPPPRLPSRTTPAPSAVPFTSAVASDFQCDAHNRAFEGIFGPPAPGLLSLADAAIRHRLSASAPPPPPTADQRRANMLSLADEVLRLSSSGSPAAAATPLPDAAADPPLLIPPPPPPEPPPDGRLQLDLVRDLVGFVDTFDGLPPPALTRSIATSCGCKKAEASTHRAIACAAYAALHPDEPANNAPANIAGSKRSMVTWRAKLRPALLLVMRERRVAALGSSAQLRAEKPEERGDGKEASALGTSASFIRCIPCTSQAGHRWLVDCRYEPPRCGAVWCGQIGCDVTIRCDCADPPAQESQPVVTPTVIDSDTETWVAAPDGTRSTLEFDSTLGFPGEGWSSSAATASSSSRVLILCSGPYARVVCIHMRSGVYTHQNGVYTHQSGVYTHQSGVYTHQSGVYTHQSGVYTHQSGVYTHQSGVYTHQSGVYTHQSGVYTHQSGGYTYTHESGGGGGGGGNSA